MFLSFCPGKSDVSRINQISWAVFNSELAVKPAYVPRVDQNFRPLRLGEKDLFGQAGPSSCCLGHIIQDWFIDGLENAGGWGRDDGGPGGRKEHQDTVAARLEGSGLTSSLARVCRARLLKRECAGWNRPDLVPGPMEMWDEGVPRFPA